MNTFRWRLYSLDIGVRFGLSLSSARVERWFVGRFGDINGDPFQIEDFESAESGVGVGGEGSGENCGFSGLMSVSSRMRGSWPRVVWL